MEESRYQKLYKIVISAVSLFMEVHCTGQRPKLERVYFQLILPKIFSLIGQKQFCYTVMVLFTKATQKIQFHTKIANFISEEVQTLVLILPTLIHVII